MNSKAAKKADASREELAKHAKDAYIKASKAGGEQYASATSNIAVATGAAKDTTFDSWTHSELKKYLDSYGIPVYQGSSINELRAAARRHATYFKYGTNTPQGTIYAKIMETVNWILDQVKLGASSGRAQGQEAAEKVREKAAEQSQKIRSEL
jgi:hypothetical protein